ncbi:pneumococcal histidine triad protein E [Streptococcus pneumoniae]|nr:pneumococcal histidine triad protein E [Streptococcus pneumoniae]CKI02769.1 pneumococcal histidine triad protein E [Streptococcus pneumoniae]CKI97079.1 pneumococcal histidine triad protein E [Streptococcus pneumoniae]CKI99122.1 pneumococcal histidine triad protein E [Streptococcus pneumoniae]CKJ09227.1 pneumococcal histidine triad protein E [Streptococcus pneumoniae]
MKFNKKYLAGSVAVLALSVCSYELGRHQAGQAKKESNRVAYIDGDQAGQKAENLTPDEVSKKEGINAEQIVIKITAQGYVTSHGDHYHYYNGKVPYDAIISEELLMKDPNYQLKDSDIVNEIKGGYVIKVDGKYYVYLKDAAHADNIRTKEEIKRQKQEHSSNHGVDSNDKAVVAARAQGRYTTDDGYIFNASDIIEDTGDAYIVPHGNHFHYIPKSNQIGQPTLPNNGLTTPSPSLPVNPDVSHEEHEEDGHGFDANRIIAEDESGFIMSHGNHNHYFFKKDLTADQIKAAQDHLKGGMLATPTPAYDDHDHHHSEGHDSSFDANRIIAEDESGFIMSHGNHNHYFFKKDLTADQIKAAQKHLEEVKTSHNGLDSLQSHEQDYSGNAKEMKDLDKKIEEKIAGIMKQYGVKRESIVVNKEKNAIIYPHGDHHHADPIDEHKPVGIGHSHSNYELFKPEEGVAKKEGNKVYTGEELTNVVNLLKNSTFNNQNFTLANGQKRVSFSFPPELEKKLGINMLVKLITPDGKVLEKVSGKVFGEGVGNIANFELDQPYLPGQTFKYTIASKDYPEVSYDGTFTVSTSLAYKMASQTIFYPFHAGDTYLRVNPQFAVPKGTDALVRVFDEFHGNAYLENNYKVGEIKLPIPKLNQGTTRTAGNKIPVTFMANAYLDNQSTYIVEVPILEKENQTDKPSILPQFKRNKAQENSKLDEKVEEPKTSEKVEKEKLTETRNSTSNSTLEEAPAVDPVQEKVEKFTASYGLGLDSVIFNMDGTIELRLPSGEVIKKNLSDLIA